MLTVTSLFFWKPTTETNHKLTWFCLGEKTKLMLSVFVCRKQNQVTVNLVFPPAKTSSLRVGIVPRTKQVTVNYSFFENTNLL